MPDPNIEYRKSQRSQQASDEMRQTQASAPAAGATAPRAPFTFGAAPAAPAARAAPVATAAADESDRLAKRTRTFEAAAPANASNAGRAPSSSADTQTYRLEAQTNVTGPFAQARSVMEAEIAAAKQMVIDLRRELHLQSSTGHSVEQQGVAATSAASRGVRRSRDEAEASGAGSSGAAVTGADAVEASTRVIRTNKTIERAPAAQRAKTFAFNTFIFGLGVGAAAYVPFCSGLCHRVLMLLTRTFLHEVWGQADGSGCFRPSRRSTSKYSSTQARSMARLDIASSARTYLRYPVLVASSLLLSSGLRLGMSPLPAKSSTPSSPVRHCSRQVRR